MGGYVRLCHMLRLSCDTRVYAGAGCPCAQATSKMRVSERLELGMLVAEMRVSKSKRLEKCLELAERLA